MTHHEIDSVIDYLELLFHTDVGEGHLEHFDVGHSLDYDILTSMVNPPIFGVAIEHVFAVSGELSFIASQYFLKDDPFLETTFKDSFSLRGPPFIS